VQLRAERQLFAATLGHDVRSPLSTIRIAGQRLEQLEASEMVRKLSGGIVRSAKRLTDLVTELLELAKSWERPVALSRERVDLAELCREVVADQRVAADGVVVRVNAPQPVLGDWDRQRLVRIVENLVENAKKHGDPDAGVDVDVGHEAEMASLAVSNRGEPIPGGSGPSIFEPYGRGATGRGGGSGLGLYIVKEFAEAHGGRVELRSDESLTTFRVLLPTGRAV
jgi:signal transduction histidine kinase